MEVFAGVSICDGFVVAPFGTCDTSLIFTFVVGFATDFLLGKILA